MSEFGPADKVMCPDDDSNEVTENDDEGISVQLRQPICI